MSTSQAAESTDSIDIGAAIYRGLADSSARVRLARGPWMPATRFACQNCHGAWAQGGTEGAVVAPALEIQTEADRTSFLMAVTTGTGKDGRRLSSTMPVYELNEKAAVALMDYVRKLEIANRAGIAADAINIVISGPVGSTGVTVRAAERLNKVWASEPLVFGRRLFATVDGSREPFLEISLAAGLPIVADRMLIAAYSLDGSENRETVFSLQATIAQQMKLVVSRMEEEEGESSIVVLTDQSTKSRRLLAALRQARKTGVNLLPIAPETVKAGFLSRRTVISLIQAPQLIEVLKVGGNPGRLILLLAESGPEVGGVQGFAHDILVVDAMPEITSRLAATHGQEHGMAGIMAGVISEIAARCGRNLSRTCFMRELKSTPIVLDSTISYDFSKFPLSGVKPVIWSFE